MCKHHTLTFIIRRTNIGYDSFLNFKNTELKFPSNKTGDDFCWIQELSVEEVFFLMLKELIYIHPVFSLYIMILVAFAKWNLYYYDNNILVFKDRFRWFWFMRIFGFKFLPDTILKHKNKPKQ